MHSFKKTRTTAFLPFQATLASALFLSPLACSQTQPKYQVLPDKTAVTFTAADIGLSDDLLRPIGSRLLPGRTSTGRFPAALCIVQIQAYIRSDTDALRADEAPKGRFLRIIEVPGHQAVYWNELLNDLPLIREVVFMRESGLDPRGYHWRTILASALERECGLCLIYARLHDSDADAELAGVLWDAQSAEPLAVMRVPVLLPVDEDGILYAANHEKPLDPTVREADFRAQQEFRQALRDVIWDLAGNDSVSPTTQPNPWKDAANPLFPRDYERYLDWRFERFLREHPDDAEN